MNTGEEEVKGNKVMRRRSINTVLVKRGRYKIQKKI